MADQVLVELDVNGQPVELDANGQFLYLRRRLNEIDTRVAHMAGQVAFVFWVSLISLVVSVVAAIIRLRG
jgi:hypothetical protein